MSNDHLFRCLTDGKEMGYAGLPFPGTGYPVPDIGNIHYWYEIINAWDTVVAIIPLPTVFLSTDFVFE